MPPRRAKDLGRAPQVEADLNDKYKVGWDFISNVPPSAFDVAESLGNQARFESINEDTVEQYAEAVARGEHFPAVIAYRKRANGKLIIIDGNHRLVAHERHQAPLDVYEVEQGTRSQVIALMTHAFNTKHGRPTSEAERVTAAIYLVNNGASQEDAAAAVNVPMRLLKKALNRARADARADEVGLSRQEWDTLPQSSKSRLLNITTDEGFKDAVHLAFAARLDSDEVFELVSYVNANGTKSARRQRELVKAKTAEYADRIQSMAGGVLGTSGKRASGPKQRLAMALGQVFALPEDVMAIARMYAASEIEEERQRIMDASERLKKIAMAMPERVG